MKVKNFKNLLSLLFGSSIILSSTIATCTTNVNVNNRSTINKDISTSSSKSFENNVNQNIINNLSADASLFLEDGSGVKGKVFYTVDESNNLAITGYDGNFNASVANFKSQITIDNNSTYTLVGFQEQAFYECSKLKSITIPFSVTIVDHHAFSNCSNLTSVTFEPNSQLKSIGYSAFYGCSLLTEIMIPSSVNLIGDSAFALTSISNINLEEGNQTYNLVNFDKNGRGKILVKKSEVSGVDWNGTASPVGCLAYGDIDYNQYPSVTHINSGIFAHTQIYSVKISNHISSIEDNAFEGCLNLKTVEFEPNSQLKNINNRSFENCIKLNQIIIPSSITSIGENAFFNCVNLSSITFSWSTKEELENLSIGSDWLSSNINYSGTIYVPIGTIPLYNQYAEKLGIQNAIIKEIPQPKEVNVLFITWLTLWVGLPTIAVIITGIGYYNSIKKHKK